VPDRLLDGTHRRYNQLLDSWVLVSAGRDRRPWQGSVEAVPVTRRPAYEPTCYLCPGNERAGGVRNPDYRGTFVFTNDFPALSPDVADAEVHDGLLLARSEAGTCRVLCYSPRHDLDLVDLDDVALRGVIDAWAAQTDELGGRFRWVQVFENRGEQMGASSPHPHGQIWAGSVLPSDPKREAATQSAHHAKTGRSLLLDYVAQESAGPRIVARSDQWTALVPFWAVWPFETLLIANEPVGRLGVLNDAGRAGLVAILRELLGRYDGLFRAPFPYSFGWHQAPFGEAEDAGDAGDAAWQLHAHFFPPMLRSATIRKFMVGYELLAEPQRDLTPEAAAERLRAVEIGGGTGS
jgi:UDPglucose--hexose-1-phosphate uridylyltransferase